MKDPELLTMIKDVPEAFRKYCDCSDCYDGDGDFDCDCCYATAMYKAGYRKVTDATFKIEYIIVKEYEDGGVKFRSEVTRTSSRERAIKLLKTYSKLDVYKFKLYWRFVGEAMEVNTQGL
ncbi:MAG: hypothetical protein LUD27_02685 [Clostridia bacterium]|nr:hypothetical protein [Clostridia bacterium]